MSTVLSIVPGPEESTIVLQVLVAAWLAVLFLQSGLDKVFNYEGNRDWLTDHFKKSPLKGTVPVLLPVITLFELAAGVLSAAGVAVLIASGDPRFGFWGASLAAISLLQLFVGQRLAQDYAGAATLVPYFLLSMLGIWLYSV